MMTTALVLSVLALFAGPRVMAAAPPGARVHVVGAGDGAPLLEARLHDLLDDRVPALVVDTAPAFHGDEPFRAADTEAAAPSAWLVLEGAHARVRAAGAGRTRFVFRDLEVGQPLTEFDRERLGQSVKASLEVLIAGGPGVLSRADAAAASGLTLAAMSPPALVAAPPAPPPPALRFRLGAFYQAESVGQGLFQGPGLVATLSGSDLPHRLELWLMAGYVLPQDVGNELASLSVDALWVRAGVGVPLREAVQLGVGGGVDRQTTRLVYVSGASAGVPDRHDDVIPVARLLVRAGPARLGGVDVSLTAFLDMAPSTERQIYAFSNSSTEFLLTVYHSNRLRPGFSLDLWWR